jgi:hypothetical protein
MESRGDASTATRSQVYRPPRPPSKPEYSIDDLDAHFADTVVPSHGAASLRTGPGTLHYWTSSEESTDEEGDETGSISRLHIFNRAAQPLYPPYIFTRSHLEILTKNINRIIPVFRRVGYHGAGKHIWDGYVKIVSVDVVPAKSPELTSFIAAKVKAGGLRTERTKEQWEETFGVDWYKVKLVSIKTSMGDPMDIKDIHKALEDI